MTGAIEGAHMLTRLVWSMLMALCLLTTAAFASGNELLSFSVRGKPVAQLSMDQLKQKAPVIQITVWEPHEDKNVTYEGFDIAKLFAAVYGEQWRKIDEALFTCVDGYQPVLPMDRFEHYAGYIVYRRLDQAQFKVQNRFQNQSDVPLGPYYLVWDNLKSSELRAEGATGWPYQVVGVDLVNFVDRFPKLSPPEDASVQAKKGFVAFRENCMACHTLNGEGGDKGPELNFPMSVTEYLSDAWLRQWIKDPRTVRYNATMPGFAAHPHPDLLIDDVLAYLEAMARHKQKPD